MKSFLTLILLPYTFLLTAQVADFENFNLTPDSHLDGSDGSGGFNSGGMFFPNFYNDAWGSWEGWAISSHTDNNTPGFGNQYSSIAGSGAEGSEHYALTFVNGKSVLVLNTNGAPQIVTSMMITNSTYAYYSMLDGDNFAKKFGGVTGDDPDYFLLTVKRYLNGQLQADSVDFYLADYRFSDNSQDYIVDDWTEVDLSAISIADSLIFTLRSSDNGAFGMNTPAYFCIDNVNSAGQVSTNNVLNNNGFTIAPNPAGAFIQFKSIAAPSDCFIYDWKGNLVYHTIVSEYISIDISDLPKGVYVVKVIGKKGIGTELLSVF